MIDTRAPGFVEPKLEETLTHFLRVPFLHQGMPSVSHMIKKSRMQGVFGVHRVKVPQMPFRDHLIVMQGVWVDISKDVDIIILKGGKFKSEEYLIKHVRF
jgi:hypothetical protein